MQFKTYPDGLGYPCHKIVEFTDNTRISKTRMLLYEYY